MPHRPGVAADSDASTDGRAGEGRPRARGQRGELHLTLARVRGRTELVECRWRPPLQVHRALHPDPAAPDMAFVYVTSLGGGVVQGDRLRIEVRAGPGARAHLTTQGATRIYRAETGHAEQALRLEAAAGAYVEYLPEPLIPFRGSRWVQTAEIVLHPEAQVLYGELWVPGRVAMGERFAYDLLLHRLAVRSPEGAVLVAETACLRPAAAGLAGPAVLGEFDVVGSLYVLTRQADAIRLAARLHEAGQPEGGSVVGVASPEALAGATVLPGGAGVLFRVVAATEGGARGALHRAWAAAREALGAGPPPPVRRY